MITAYSLKVTSEFDDGTPDTLTPQADHSTGKSRRALLKEFSGNLGAASQRRKDLDDKVAADISLDVYSFQTSDRIHYLGIATNT